MHHHPSSSTTTSAVFGRALRHLLAVGLVLMAAGHALADEIRLRPHVKLPAGPVTLADVAMLQGEEAQKLGKLVLATLADQPVSISMGELRSKLDEQKVNWGRLSLRGFMACRISSAPQPELPQEVVSHALAIPDHGSAAANPADAVDTRSIMTLGDMVRNKLIARTGHDAADVRITFSRHDEKSLSLSVLSDRWEMEPIAQGRLGRVLVTVRQWRGQRVIQTHRISADVAWRALVVVMTRDIARQEVLTQGDVKIAEVYLDSDRTQPLSELASALGQAATTTLRAGQVLCAEDVAKPMLIRRGDRLTVRVIVGGMVIRTTARAMDQGGMGDVITVANMDSNERFAVRVVGPRQAVPVAAAAQPGKEKKS